MTLILAMLACLLMPALADAGTFTMRWDPAATATSYDVEQAGDAVNGPWTLTKNVLASACAGTPVVCTTSIVGPTTGVMHYRIAAKNAVGSTIRYSEGVWHCQSCAPPLAVTGLGVQ